MNKWTLGQFGKTNPKRTQTNPIYPAVASGEAGTNPIYPVVASGEAGFHRVVASDEDGTNPISEQNHVEFND